MFKAGTKGREFVGGLRLRSTVLLALLPLISGQAPDDPTGKSGREAQILRERVIEVYAREAEGYAIYRDASRSEKLVLRREPVYFWSNPTRAGGQDGAVFIWAFRGRAEVVGTIFSFPGKGKRTIDHEFLSIATTVLDVERTGPKSPSAIAWSPRVPGVTPRAIPDAPAPGRTPTQRLSQMRDLASGFSGTTQNQEERRWELRLLPKPLYRFESTDPDILDGAVFAFVSSAGTDPEAILVLEARKAPGATTPTWHYAVGRYTDMALRMRLKDHEILSVPFLSGSNPEDRYHVINDRVIPPIEDGELPPKPAKP